MKRIFLAGFFLLLAGITSAQQGSVITGDAYILSAAVRDTGSAILLDVRVELGDACTEVGEITQSVSGNTITVSVQTTRPADAMCAQVLTIFETTIPLDTAALQPGDYTLQINNQKLSVSITAQAQAVTADPCPVEDEAFATFTAPDNRYCFLYPAELTAEVLEDGTVLVASDPLVVPGVSLQVSVEPAGERTLAEIVAQRQQQFEGDQIQFEAVQLDDVLALYSDDIPQQIGTRVGYVLHEDRLLTFTLQPVDQTFPDATENAEILWAALVESFRFIDAEQAANCPEADDGTLLFEGSGLCFLHPAEYLVISSQTQIMVMSASGGNVVMLLTFTPISGGTLDDLEARLSFTYPDADLQVARIELGGIAALLSDDVPGRVGSRLAQLLIGDRLLTLVLQPVDDTLPDDTEAALALWDTVSDSLVFTGQ